MKEKLIFFIKCFLVMIPFFAIMIYAKTNLLSYADSEAPNYLWNKNVCTNDTVNYDVIILGDSVANSAYMPEILSNNCINLSLGGATPMETYYILKEYLAYHTPPGSAYISFMDYHFTESDYFWERSMYSHRYNWRDNLEMLKAAQSYDEKSIIVDNTTLNWLAYELCFPSKYITSLCNAGFNQRYNENIETYKLSTLYKGRYIARGIMECDESENVEYDTFYVSPLFDDYYKKLIALCLENNIKVHLIKLPLPDTATFTEQYYQEYTNYYNDLKKLYPSITVDWWENYELFCFVDDHHMNNHGALRFSSELKRKYPNEFNTLIDTDQIAALNNNIMLENYLPEVMRWASVCNEYTLVIYDGIGDFETRYQEDFYQENLIVSRKILEEHKEVLYILGSKENSAIYDQIITNGQVINVIFNDGSIYEWYPYTLDGIYILVIDNIHGELVCEKEFPYNGSGYFTFLD